MASDIRKEWQDFKKKHPNFEKSKNFKADVGPMLDKFDKGRDKYQEMEAAKKKLSSQVAADAKAIGMALKAYGAIITELSKSDPSMAKDFSKLDFDNFYETFGQQYEVK